MRGGEVCFPAISDNSDHKGRGEKMMKWEKTGKCGNKEGIRLPEDAID